jgi:hypothetical protein
MAKVLDSWTVLPHGPLTEITDGILTVQGDIVMPLGHFPRRMTVVRLAGKRTAIWSAIALGEAQMARIEDLGKPSFLIVPGIAHRMDIKIWKRRYPEARVITAPGARAAVEKVVPVDLVTDRLDDDAVHFETVPGTGQREAALRVRRKEGLTLIVNDIIAHVRHPHGLGAKIMARLMGFGVNGPQMPWVGARMFVDDRAALAAWMLSLASDETLTRIIVSHGDPISQNPQKVLAEVANRLHRSEGRHAAEANALRKN